MKRLLPVFTVAAIVACAPVETIETANAAPDGRDCFNVRNVNGWGYVDRDTVRLSVGASRDYEVDLRGASCGRELRWSQSIALDASPTNWICADDTSLGHRLIVRNRALQSRQSCFIDAVRRVVEEEDAPEDAET